MSPNVYPKYSQREFEPSQAITSAQLAESVSMYLEATAENSVLREHQVDVFEDVGQFFEDGHRRGYIELPTGTGKTVLFVELAKALLHTPEGARKPNILVVTPTQDLVLQTMGRSGKKGFGGFAADLTVVPYYSKSTDSDRENFTSADVGITTYSSFNKLRHAKNFVLARELGGAAIANEYLKQINKYHTYANRFQWPAERERSYALAHAQEYMKHKFKGTFAGPPMLNTFDIVFLDEAHHALKGTAAWATIENALPKDAFIIGFTATPDANDERTLTQVLPEKIHSLTLNEAIDIGILSPLVPVAIDSGMRIEGTDIYTAAGEYIDDKISYLGRSEARNNIILNAAEVFARRGVGTIISCIAGGNARHPRILADQLLERGIKAAAVYSDIEASDRAIIYQQFEAGEIDVLTFIGVLGEGWDSQRAKAIINARPTRSPIFAVQRPGRVARPGNVAYTVDIQDHYEQGIPPISVADILTTDGAQYGEVFGQVSEDEQVAIATILQELKDVTPTLSRLQSTYRTMQEVIMAAPKLKHGHVSIDGHTYTAPSRTSAAYANVTSDILLKAAEIDGVELDQIEVDNNGVMRIAYDLPQASHLLRTLPIVDPEKYHIRPDHTKWAAPSGLTQLFSKRYPQASVASLQQILDKAELLQWIPARQLASPAQDMKTRYRVLKLYEVSQEALREVNSALKAMYKNEIDN